MIRISYLVIRLELLYIIMLLIIINGSTTCTIQKANFRKNINDKMLSAIIADSAHYVSRIKSQLLYDSNFVQFVKIRSICV